MNAAFVGIPYSTISWGLVAFNMYESIEWQRVWANGNIFLVSKTLYMIIQTAILFPLLFEVDVWLRHMKWLRFISLTIAIAYNMWWVTAFGIYYWQVYNPPPWYKYDIVSGMMNLFLGYSLIFDSLSVPVNTFIIGKEISMEFL